MMGSGARPIKTRQVLKGKPGNDKEINRNFHLF